MMDMRRLVALLLSAAMLMGLIVGCGGTPAAGEPEGSTPTTAAPAQNKTVKIAYVNWAEDVAMTHLAEVVLEDKMGYEVETIMADIAPVFTSVASGNTDVFLDAALPYLHKDYMEEYGDDLEDLGPNYEGSRCGLVVPAYVDIDSIEELNDNKDAFDGKIIGIDSGAGIMSMAETAIEEYGLEFELINGSGPAMTAALKAAIDQNQPIVVTGWTPHWKFARWDLKILEDPKVIFGESGTANTVVRKGFSEDMPEVAAFLKNFKVTDAELGDLMGIIEDNADKDPLDVTREWAGEHEDLINSWLPAQ